MKIEIAIRTWSDHRQIAYVTVAGEPDIVSDVADAVREHVQSQKDVHGFRRYEVS